MKSIFLKIVFTCTVIAMPCSSFAQEAEDDTGRQIFSKKCSGCHGKDGNTAAFGISRKLVEISASEMGERLSLFSTDKNLQNAGGVSGVMSKQVAMLNKQEFESVLLYIKQNFATDKQ
ncbi:MAG: c-type cytochrome [Campylobacteraceae bacterium]|jgi:cytochrome c553|nr:c-type cytochrome [Campylobacteraceae bacterium]